MAGSSLTYRVRPESGDQNSDSYEGTLRKGSLAIWRGRVIWKLESP